MVLTLPMESLLDDAIKERLSKHFGDKIAGIPQEQLMTLALAYSEEEVSNERLHYALNMHQADITKMLGKMCSQHLLESTGRGRGTKCHVFGIEVIPPQKVATSKGTKVATSKGTKVATSSRKVATSGRKVATSEGRNVATSGSNMATSEGRNVATSGSNVATSGSNVATSKKRYSREELRKMIVGYCAEWHTLDDIAAFIGRNSKYLRNYVLPQMTDVIEKMYEDIPNHPRQKYKARDRH